MDSLLDREVLLVLRYGLFGEPRRFDVVICRYPGRKGLFVKRIIALPGETISMHDDEVYINGEPIDEPFQRRRCLRTFDEIKLDVDEYFVMGDNRPVSQDSRRVGALKRGQLLARAVCVLWPIGGWRWIDRSSGKIR